MAIIDLQRIKKFITGFFVVALLLQMGFIFYTSQTVLIDNGNIAVLLSELKQVSFISVLSIGLNLIVILVAVYGINVSMVHCHRRN